MRHSAPGVKLDLFIREDLCSKKNVAFFSQQFKFFSKNLKEKKRIWRLHIRIKTSLFWDYFCVFKTSFTRVCGNKGQESGFSDFSGKRTGMRFLLIHWKLWRKCGDYFSRKREKFQPVFISLHPSSSLFPYFHFESK